VLIEFDNNTSYFQRIEQYQSLRDSILFCGRPNEIIMLTKELIDLYSRTKNWQKVDAEFKFGMSYSKINSESSSIVSLKLTYANYLRLKSEFNFAIDLFISCYYEAKKIKSEQFCYDALSGLAEIYRIKGMNNYALKIHIYLIKKFKHIRNYKGEIWAMLGIAQIYRIQGDFEKSLYHYSTCLKICERNNDFKNLAFAKKGFGESLALLYKSSASIENILESIELFKNVGYFIGEGYSYKTLGDVSRILKKNYDAYDSARHSYEIFKHSNYLTGLNYAIKGLADSHVQFGLFENAKNYYLIAGDYFFLNKINYGYSQCIEALNNITYGRKKSQIF
jgi:tetratricopeptide (TPR) repeat protein